MGSGASITTLSAQEIADALDSIGSAYSIYKEPIIANGIDGEVLSELKSSEDVNDILDGIGVKTKLYAKILTVRLSKLKRSSPSVDMHKSSSQDAMLLYEERTNESSSHDFSSNHDKSISIKQDEKDDPFHNFAIKTSMEKTPREIMVDLFKIQGIPLDPSDTMPAYNQLRNVIVSNPHYKRGYADGKKTFDCFISYRVNTESNLATQTYYYLTSQGIHPFLDTFSLMKGMPWKEMFLNALKHSQFFVPLISEAGLITVRDSGVDHSKDSLLLEYENALDINNSTKDASFIIPIHVGESIRMGESIVLKKFSQFDAKLYSKVTTPDSFDESIHMTSPILLNKSSKTSSVDKVSYHVMFSTRWGSNDIRLVDKLCKAISHLEWTHDVKSLQVYTDFGKGNAKNKTKMATLENTANAILNSLVIVVMLSFESLQKMVDHHEDHVDSLLVEWILIILSFGAKQSLTTRIYPIFTGERDANNRVMKNLFDCEIFFNLPDVVPTASLNLALSFMKKAGVIPQPHKLTRLTVRGIIQQLRMFYGYTFSDYRQISSRQQSTSEPIFQVDLVAAVKSIQDKTRSLEVGSVDAIEPDEIARTQEIAVNILKMVNMSYLSIREDLTKMYDIFISYRWGLCDSLLSEKLFGHLGSYTPQLHDTKPKEIQKKDNSIATIDEVQTAQTVPAIENGKKTNGGISGILNPKDVEKEKSEKNQSISVYLDLIIFENGMKWDLSASHALIYSKVAVPIISYHALQGLINHNPRNVDFVLFDWIQILLTKDCKDCRLQKVYSVLIGPVVKNSAEELLIPSNKKDIFMEDFITAHRDFASVVMTLSNVKPVATIDAAIDTLEDLNITISPAQIKWMKTCSVRDILRELVKRSDHLYKNINGKNIDEIVNEVAVEVVNLLHS